jgi:catechol 2,3-dioxygenase-like lactoylglutathione lyase family enzyme
MESDHITVFVKDYDASKRFYEEVLAPLGLVKLLDWPDNRRVYFGRPGEPSSLWLVESEFGGHLEVTLPASDEGAVHSFHNTAISAGARSGSEPSDGSERVAARVLDFDGNSLEAVFRGEAAAALRPAAA